MLISFLFIQNLFSASISIEVKNHNLNTTKKVVETVLKKINAKYKSLSETNGFQYHFQSLFFSPYDFDIYIDSLETENTKTSTDKPISKTGIVHIESMNRQSFTLADIIVQEAMSNNNTKETPTTMKSLYKNSYETKSIVLGDFLTLLSPSLGYLYANTSSPNARRSSLLVSLIYLGVDGFLFLAGSTSFFTDSFDPTGDGLIPMVSLLATHRLIQFLPIHYQISAHNKMVSLGYKFRF